MNLRSPYLLGKEKHPEIAMHLRGMLADQICAAADYLPLASDEAPTL